MYGLLKHCLLFRSLSDQTIVTMTYTFVHMVLISRKLSIGLSHLICLVIIKSLQYL